MQDEEFIIWNPALGVRDFVTIGEIKNSEETIVAWLEDPYDMVGPFSLEELQSDGKISFEACFVMSRKRWERDQIFLRQESFEKQRKAQEDHNKEIRRFNQQKQNNEQKYRELLCLPLQGSLEVSQIKNAFRRMCKTAHPDVGGSEAEFIEITIARDVLLENLSF